MGTNEISVGCLRGSGRGALLTRKEPQARTCPSALTATLMLSPAATETARKPSSSRAGTIMGHVSSSSVSMILPGFSGSGTFEVILPSAAASLIPHDQTWMQK